MKAERLTGWVYGPGITTQLSRDDPGRLPWFCLVTTRRRYPFLPWRWETEFWSCTSARFFVDLDLAPTIRYGKVLYKTGLAASAVYAIHDFIIDHLAQLADSDVSVLDAATTVVNELEAQQLITGKRWTQGTSHSTPSGKSASSVQD
jgi:hypothetical protein